MEKGRLEAFTDGVIAVIITIMVLELKAPHEATWSALVESAPIFLSYVLSFLYVGIYWTNHHHLMQAVDRIDGRVLWANLFFLFFLSLVPFATGWLNEAHPRPASVPTAFYGFVLLMTSLAWIPLVRSLRACNGGADSALARLLGNDLKGWVSTGAYVVAIALVFVNPLSSCVLYACVAALWFVPDRRIERGIAARQ